MASVDPKLLVRDASGDFDCPNCGSNSRVRPTDAVCPQCGVSLEWPKESLYLNDHFVRHFKDGKKLPIAEFKPKPEDKV